MQRIQAIVDTNIIGTPK